MHKIGTGRISCIFPLLVAALAFGPVSCEGGGVYYWTCEHPCKTCDEPCAECAGGTCAPLPPLGWSMPVLLWTGASSETPPACPERAPLIGYEGYVDLVPLPADCGECVCEPPVGSCVLPTGMFVSTDSMCPGDEGAVVTSFAASDGWNGTCDASNPIPPNAVCGQTLCAQSLHIDPITLIEDGCTPKPARPHKQITAIWNDQGLACTGTLYDACGDPSSYCLPSDVPPGFRQCVFRPGETDAACPEPFSERILFYEDYQDDRQCTACSCAPPTGSSCSTTITIYTDDACEEPSLMLPQGDEVAVCTVFGLPGQQLGSKSASRPVYLPGSCQPSGGELVGSVHPVSPSTFCCTL